MSIEANKTVARRFVEEVWNGGDLAVAAELLGAELVNHDGDGGTTDRDGFLRAVAAFRAADPDLRFTVEDLVGEGEKVATRVTVRGTRAGAAAPPTTWTGIGIVRVVDGKIVEQWADTEAMGASATGEGRAQP